MREALALPSKESDTRLWKLENPYECAKQGADAGRYIQINEPSTLVPGERPLLFLHGAEYEGPGEVVQDLVQPFLKSLYLEHEGTSIGHSPVYFISWNSALTSPKERLRLRTQPQRLRALSVLGKLPKWHLYFRDVEERAASAALELYPFVLKWMTNKAIGPTVISHSLGAKVWADILKEMNAQSQTPVKPGIWWNLQPALSHRAFAPGGEYEMISRLYQASEHGRTVVWYSRLDLVLSTLYLVAKGDRALGQFGCRKASLPQRDVTRWTREAHGANHLGGRMGCFFRRVAHLIPQEARTLGILQP